MKVNEKINAFGLRVFSKSKGQILIGKFKDFASYWTLPAVFKLDSVTDWNDPLSLLTDLSKSIGTDILSLISIYNGTYTAEKNGVQCPYNITIYDATVEFGDESCPEWQTSLTWPTWVEVGKFVNMRDLNLLAMTLRNIMKKEEV